MAPLPCCECVRLCVHVCDAVLRGGVLRQAFAPRPSFPFKFIEANKEMFIVNKAITEPHHWGSRYNQWVINARGLAYWGDEGEYKPETGRCVHSLCRSVASSLSCPHCLCALAPSSSSSSSPSFTPSPPTFCVFNFSSFFLHVHVPLSRVYSPPFAPSLQTSPHQLT